MRLDTLNNLNIDEEGVIIENFIKNNNKQNIINLGATIGSKIKCLYKSPFKDPIAYEVKNTIIGIREEDSKNIMILRTNNGTN